MALARDIVANGLDPANLPIVTPANDDLKRYIVLEGNRRLTALRGLENPDSLVGVLDATTLNEFRALSKQYQQNPIEAVHCIVVKSREEARHWIELRHTGQNEGAGLVPWGSDESARFRARTGEIEIHSQALSYLESHGHLTPVQRSEIPATSFKRLLNTPEVRAKCGLELKKGKLQYLADHKQIAKVLLYIAHDLASGKTKTERIYTRGDRIKYANKLPRAIVVQPSMKKGKPLVSGQRLRVIRPKFPRVRDHLIPRDCVLSVTDPRISHIEVELRALNIEEYTNAVSVLFRVFVELSLDAYITAKALPIPEESSLGAKMKGVMDDLLSKKKITSQQATPVRRAMQRDSFLAPSLQMMHKYLHCAAVFPAASDLRAHWDSLQPFLVAMWT